ncbi:hypothetical protein MRX96_006868 [Rhipicephalus microplus]
MPEPRHARSSLRDLLGRSRVCMAGVRKTLLSFLGLLVRLLERRCGNFNLASQWPTSRSSDVGRPFAICGASVNFTTDASFEKVDSNREATTASSL